MPRFSRTTLVRTPDVEVMRVVCDGCDPARPCEEHAERASLCFVTSGAFEIRDRGGIRALDPTRAFVFPAGAAFVIRHPAGPDVCVCTRGPLVDEIAAGLQSVALTPIAPASVARVAMAISAATSGGADDLGVAESIVACLEATVASIHAASIQTASIRTPSIPASEPRRDRELVEAVAHELRVGFAEPTSLAELADRIGYSVFHLCRVFRAATGETIHGFRRELRLRHALARIVDGDEPLAAIAAETGFASQSHLTNLFRARFGITPAKARTRVGLRQLAA